MSYASQQKKMIKKEIVNFHTQLEKMKTLVKSNKVDLEDISKITGLDKKLLKKLFEDSINLEFNLDISSLKESERKKIEEVKELFGLDNNQIQDLLEEAYQKEVIK